MGVIGLQSLLITLLVALFFNLSESHTTHSCPRIHTNKTCSEDDHGDLCTSDTDCCRLGDRCCSNGCRFQCTPHEILGSEAKIEIRECPKPPSKKKCPTNVNDKCKDDSECCRDGDKCCSNGCNLECTRKESLITLKNEATYSECPKIRPYMGKGNCTDIERQNLCEKDADCCRQGDKCCYNGCASECIPRENLIYKFCQHNGLYYQPGDKAIINCEECLCDPSGRFKNCVPASNNTICGRVECPKVDLFKKCWDEERVHRCHDNNDCRIDELCCFNGCGMECTRWKFLIRNFCYLGNTIFWPGDDYITDCHMCTCDMTGNPTNCTAENCVKKIQCDQKGGSISSKELNRLLKESGGGFLNIDQALRAKLEAERKKSDAAKKKPKNGKSRPERSTPGDQSEIRKMKSRGHRSLFKKRFCSIVDEE